MNDLNNKNSVIVDCRACDKTVYSLENMGFEVIPTVKIDNLYNAVATHADMQIHYMGKNGFVCASEAYDHYKSHIMSVPLIKGSKPIGSKYPDDVLYNAASFGDYVICNAACTAIEILETYKSMGKRILNVRQGYSKCSVCIADRNSIITSDKGIARIAEKNKIDVLLIDVGHIELTGMDYGFIGGATGLIKENVLAVNGDINTHPDSDRIKQFLKDRAVEIVCLKRGIMTDIGSILSKIDI